MRLQDKTVILMDHDEVFDVFYGPVSTYFKEGGAHCAAYAGAQHLKLDKAESQSLTGVDFDNKNLKAYWEALYDTALYPHFDFTTGLEDASEDTYRARPKGDVYLDLAQHIANKGLVAYSIRHVSAGSSQSVEFVDNRTHAVFAFKSTVDVNMYNSALHVFRTQSQTKACAEDREMTAELMTG